MILDMVKIYDEETPTEIALKVFHKFEIFQSCKITGWEDETDLRNLKPKGEAVLEQIRYLDKLHNFAQYGKHMVRHRRKIENSIGDFVAHKIFKWTKVIDDNVIKYTIWRIQ